MKLTLTFTLFAAAATVFSQSTPPPAPDGSWKKLQLTDNFWAEGVAVADVDKDGKVDVLYGPYWFAGPDFTKRHTIYPDTQRFKVKQADGSEKEIEIPKHELCAACSGLGLEPGTQLETCTRCGGSGEIRRAHQSIFGQFVNVSVCDTCSGEGRVNRTPCATCHGA